MKLTLKSKKNPGNIGFILRNLQKMLFFLGLMSPEDGVYMKDYVKEKFVSLFLFCANTFLRGLLWYVALLPFHFVGWIDLSSANPMIVGICIGFLDVMFWDSVERFVKNKRKVS